MYLLHAAWPPESRLGVRECAAEDHDRVVNPTGVPMQHFLRHESPLVDLVGYRGWDRTSALMGYVNVCGADSRWHAAARGQGWNFDAAVKQEDGRRDAGRKRSGGT